LKTKEFHLHDSRGGAALAIRIIPRSNNNQLVEVLDDGTIKIHLQYSSDDAGLNQALLDYLSTVLNVPANQMDVVAGEQSLVKLISIINMDAPSLQARLVKTMS
jgi:uncharacterized protein YggU (UPF0235/DUF167 family)